MTIFVDASAIVAMMTDEFEASRLVETLEQHVRRFASAVVNWESARAIARKRKIMIEEAAAAVEMFMADYAIEAVSIGTAEASVAIEAHARFGKGQHDAHLNMGDCFAYACAKTNNARLLYKGDDFIHTDLA